MSRRPIDEFYHTEVNMQTGLFSPSSDPPSPPPQLLTTARNVTTGVPLPMLSVSSPRSTADDDDEHRATRTMHEKYLPRTLGPHNIARMSVLPAFPSAPVAASTAVPHLLLSNVPLDQLDDEQYARVRRRAFPLPFRLESTAADSVLPPCDSFLLRFYADLYVNTKKRLKVDIPVIDFNLIRLLDCLDRVAAQGLCKQSMLTMDELAMALEFYLQIDVDLFFLKTCSFNGVEPRWLHNRCRESLFCLGTPQARFALAACQKRQCLCCRSPCPRRYATGPQPTVPMQFSVPHIHRFVNQYEAILNCPATCETGNCIYVLTCPCRQFDFIGESTAPLTETLSMHRDEGNRIIREFLIGEQNTDLTTAGLKSEQKRANDKRWLYQHSARCPVAMQLFLDYNPDYWCFVPRKTVEMRTPNGNIRAFVWRRSMANDEEAPPETIALPSWTRTDEEIIALVQNVPKPPPGFDFPSYERPRHAGFFQWAQDRVVPARSVDLYNADIVAVLPDDCSELFRQLVASLLITHAECKLNEVGHLIQGNADSNRALSTVWCANLTRRPALKPLF